jgi:hypothetical protein
VVNFLQRLLGRGGGDEADDADVPVTLDVARRKVQLLRLEQALDELSAQMRSHQSVDNPGWRERVNEYSRLAGEAMVQRQGELSRDQLLDLVFEVRPVFSGAIPAGMEWVVPLQNEVMAAANELQELLPGERG